jgi:hypothetical protein
MKQNFVANIFGLVSANSFPESLHIESDIEVTSSDDPIIPVLCLCNETIALGNGSLLSISNITNNSENELIETEFDNEIVAMCWDQTGQFLIVGDIEGNVHFLTSNGTLIFSHRIFSRKYIYFK